jgi:hypothetical protein
LLFLLLLPFSLILSSLIKGLTSTSW